MKALEARLLKEKQEMETSLREKMMKELQQEKQAKQELLNRNEQEKKAMEDRFLEEKRMLEQQQLTLTSKQSQAEQRKLDEMLQRKERELKQLQTKFEQEKQQMEQGFLEKTKKQEALRMKERQELEGKRERELKAKHEEQQQQLTQELEQLKQNQQEVQLLLQKGKQKELQLQQQPQEETQTEENEGEPYEAMLEKHKKEREALDLWLADKSGTSQQQLQKETQTEEKEGEPYEAMLERHKKEREALDLWLADKSGTNEEELLSSESTLEDIQTQLLSEARAKMERHFEEEQKQMRALYGVHDPPQEGQASEKQAVQSASFGDASATFSQNQAIQELFKIRDELEALFDYEKRRLEERISAARRDLEQKKQALQLVPKEADAVLVQLDEDFAKHKRRNEPQMIADGFTDLEKQKARRAVQEHFNRHRAAVAKRLQEQVKAKLLEYGPRLKRQERAFLQLEQDTLRQIRALEVSYAKDKLDIEARVNVERQQMVRRYLTDRVTVAKNHMERRYAQRRAAQVGQSTASIPTESALLEKTREDIASHLSHLNQSFEDETYSNKRDPYANMLPKTDKENLQEHYVQKERERRARLKAWGGASQKAMCIQSSIP
eukprot:g6969.t1